MPGRVSWITRGAGFGRGARADLDPRVRLEFRGTQFASDGARVVDARTR